MMKRKIKLHGLDFILIGDNDGAIATPEQYANFDISYAHLYRDGTIMRFSKQIGTIDDIEFLEVIDDNKGEVIL